MALKLKKIFLNKEVIISSILLGVLIPLYFYLLFYNGTSTWLSSNFVISAIFSATMSWLVYTINSAYCDYIGSVYSYSKHPYKRVIYIAIGTSLLAIFLGWFWTEIFAYLYFNITQERVNINLATNISICFIINALVVSVMEGRCLFFLWKKSLIDSEKLKQENLKAQYETLKNQINPHFLFNSLNTLAGLIPEDSKKGVEFVEKLSLFYRNVLIYRDKELIELSDELVMVDAYIYLQKMRFDTALILNISIDRERINGVKIPPMAIQILVENAIKHNVVSHSNPLKIEIELDSEFIVVKNRIQRKKSLDPSTHLGLSNLAERVRLLNSEIDLIINDDSNFFIVQIPIFR